MNEPKGRWCDGANSRMMAETAGVDRRPSLPGKKERKAEVKTIRSVGRVKITRKKKIPMLFKLN